MNCANHADASAVAYCRTCGKPLCAGCTRPVKGVIYCEDCLGSRMEGTIPPAAFVAPAAGSPTGTPPVIVVPAPAASSSGPNPTVAGILAGVFPFGVGAVYTGQYAKGLAHLSIFALLVAGCNVSGSDVLPAICGIGIAFFIVYQIVDAVRSARAIQAGLPAPDPYGLAATFGGGSKIDASGIPVGAIVLILVGILFLLHTAGVFDFGMERVWPLILMFLGGWLFARNYGWLGSSNLGDRRYGSRRLMGPAVLFTVGALFFLESLRVAPFHRTWPVILLVIGGIKLAGGNTPANTNPLPPDMGAGSGGFTPPPPPPPPAPPAPPSSDAKQSEVNNG